MCGVRMSDVSVCDDDSEVVSLPCCSQRINDDASKSRQCSYQDGALLANSMNARFDCFYVYGMISTPRWSALSFCLVA